MPVDPFFIPMINIREKFVDNGLSDRLVVPTTLSWVVDGILWPQFDNFGCYVSRSDA